jgi:hypothetical protein
VRLGEPQSCVWRVSKKVKESIGAAQRASATQRDNRYSSPANSQFLQSQLPPNPKNRHLNGRQLSRRTPLERRPQPYLAWAFLIQSHFALRFKRLVATRSHNCAMPRSASQYRHRNAAHSALVLNRSTVCSGQVFSSVSPLALRSGLQRISSTTGVSDRLSLPVFRPRIVKDSGALRRSRATGAPSATYCITISLRTMKRDQKITFCSDGHQRTESPVPKGAQPAVTSRLRPATDRY